MRRPPTRAKVAPVPAPRASGANAACPAVAGSPSKARLCVRNCSQGGSNLGTGGTKNWKPRSNSGKLGFSEKVILKVLFSNEGIELQ